MKSLMCLSNRNVTVRALLLGGENRCGAGTVHCDETLMLWRRPQKCIYFVGEQIVTQICVMHIVFQMIYAKMWVDVIFTTNFCNRS